MSRVFQFEVVVIGGGLAGSAAASLLARGGVSVALIEQHAAPQHKVCGEFLSAEALDSLGQLGVSVPSLGGVAITQVLLAAGGALARAALPFPALSLTRRRLDEALLQKAALTGARVFRGQPVEWLTHDQGGARWQAILRSGDALLAPHAMLATGKHDLRAFPRPPGQQNHLVAFKQYFTLTPAQTAALDGTVELSLFPGGYAGLQPVEADPLTHTPRANLCLVMDQAAYRALGSSWPALLLHLGTHSPLLRERLSGASALLPKPLALARIPYGMLLRGATEAALPDGSDVDTLWRLGDQAEVIPSFTGDGMSLALHTAFFAAACYRRGATPDDFYRGLSRTVAPQIRRATAVSRLLLTTWARPLIRLTTPLLPVILRQLARGTRIPLGARITSSAICEKPAMCEKIAR